MRLDRIRDFLCQPGFPGQSTLEFVRKGRAPVATGQPHLQDGIVLGTEADVGPRRIFIQLEFVDTSFSRGLELRPK